LIEAFLVWFIIVRCCEKTKIGAEFFRSFRKFNSLLRAVGTGTGDDRHLAMHVFYGELDNLLVFLIGESGASPVVPQGTTPFIPPLS